MKVCVSDGLSRCLEGQRLGVDDGGRSLDH